MQRFDSWFQQATGHSPFPYQRRLACDGPLPTIVDIPTGLGKTAAVALGWLWRRRFADEATRVQTPRRLIYCLPSRVLVDQTADAIRQWLGHLDMDDVCVHVLMGGAVDEAWLQRPEHDAVLVGTQDMLLSRALNRGFGVSRYLWPMAFAGVHTDACWVFDELQLMGAGLPCSTQLQGFRDMFGAFGPSHSLWMSATVGAAALGTVDHAEPAEGWRRLRLDDADHAHPLVRRRSHAGKRLSQSPVSLDTGGADVKPYATALATAVVDAHEEGSLSLVVVNRVDRAQAIYAALLALGRSTDTTALIHSRFRPHDRRHQERLLQTDSETQRDRIIVATQTVEAGVDISSATLWTELAPWSSLIQRMGRCHRYGELPRGGRVFWIDMPAESAVTLPYDTEALDDARRAILQLPEDELGSRDCGLTALAAVDVPARFKVMPVPRRRDLLELFDTDPDLSGDDLDVSRFIRDSDDTDVQLFWRTLDDAPDKEPMRPTRDELCRVSISAIQKAIKGAKGTVLWRWSPIDRRWQRTRRPVPGRTYLVAAEAGLYSADLGWIGAKAKAAVAVVGALVGDEAGDGESQESDPRSRFNVGPWVPLTTHLGDVAAEMRRLLHVIPLAHKPPMRDASATAHEESPRLHDALVEAARWHDVGKAHEAFQFMLAGLDGVDAPDADVLWAKSGTPTASPETAKNQPPRPKRRRPSTAVPAPSIEADTVKNTAVKNTAVKEPARRHVRRGFRHELASALAWLHAQPATPDGDLIAYLIAAHHGKVRLRITPLPGERGPADGRAFARGVWHSDTLPVVALGDGRATTELSLDLSLMRLGDGPSGPSWTARTAGLLREWGPFQLAWLETLVRLADWRASAAERQAGPNNSDKTPGGLS